MRNQIAIAAVAAAFALCAAYENNVSISIQLSLKKLREHPLSDAIMAVFKKYEDMKFPGGMTRVEDR